MSKPRVIKDYEKLPEELIEQIKLEYPRGFHKHLIQFTNPDGQKRKGLPFEVEDRIYLIRMTEEKAINIVDEDDDYDEDGFLKEDIKDQYTEKYAETDDLLDDDDLPDDEEDTDVP